MTSTLYSVPLQQDKIELEIPQEEIHLSLSSEDFGP